MKNKEELELYSKWLDENIQPLIEKKKAVDNALKAMDKPGFDFEKLMPVGSVWLGVKHFEVEFIAEDGPVFEGNPEECFKEIYHAHQIVKAAQEHVKTQSNYLSLKEAVNEAEKAGVLQNLE